MSNPEPAPASAPAQDQAAIDQERRKKTLLLMVGGALSLLLPLLGVAYLKLKDARVANGPQKGSEVFERREADDAKIVLAGSNAPQAFAAPDTSMPALTATQGFSGTSAPSAPLPSGGRGPAAAAAAMGSSLDFIRGADAAKTEPPAVSAQAPAAAPAPAAAELEEEEPKPVAKAKPGKKAFVMPKLNPTRGFSGALGGKKNASSADGPPDLPPDMMDSIPGMDNPDVQKALKKVKK